MVVTETKKSQAIPDKVMEKASFVMGQALTHYCDNLDLQNHIDYIQEKMGAFSLAVALIYQIKFVIQKCRSTKRGRPSAASGAHHLTVLPGEHGACPGHKQGLPWQSIPGLQAQAFCQKHGLMFEIIDLRWGIHADMDAGRLATTPLLLEEIRRCQTLSVGPSFVALLGSQYSNCSAPPIIQKQEFEAFRALLLEEPHTLQLLAQWYRKDENAVPPVYVLHRPLQASLIQEKSLVSALRRAAREAERQGLLSGEQHQLLNKSDLHWEIEAGLFSAGDHDLGALVFFREAEALIVPESDGETSQPGKKKAENTPDSEDQQMLADLKAKIAALHPKQLRVHTVSRSWDPTQLRHKPQPKYLKELCEQFIAAINHQVLASLRSQEGSHREPRWLLQELAHHQALGHKQSQAFCWQQALLGHICQRMKQDGNRAHAPLLIRGPPGCGKTAFLCHLSKAVHGSFGQEAVVVLRLLGTSQRSSSLDSLLYSICLQVSLALGLPLPCAEGTSSSVLLFHHLLLSASHQGTKPLIILLDSVEQLCIPRGACMAFWLPKICPPNVHLIVSILLAEHNSLHQALKVPEEYFEMGPLSQEEAREALAKHLAAAGRTLTPAQQALFQQSFPEGGHALPVALVITEAQHWTSYTPLSAQEISLSVTEKTHRLCGYLEQVHGPILVGRALSYLVCSRSGLSEIELKDILSLDNEVLCEIYQLHPSPSMAVLRVPPLLWARLYQDLEKWLEERWADGFLLMGFGHREFLVAVEERYLSAPVQRTQRHLILADFFRGTWSWGMKKPVKLPSSSKPVSVDRKVTPQPLWFSSTTANQRKLSELPFHLLRAGRMEELQRDIFGNMNWIACKTVVSGAGSVADDIEACLAQTSCPQLRLLQDCFLLLQPHVKNMEGQAEVSMVYTELLARLHFFVPSHSSLIGNLCHQCENWLGARPHPVLIPLCGFLYPPEGPLQKTLAGSPKGTTVLELSLDHRLLLAGSQDGTLTVWDTGNFSVLHILTGHSAEVTCVRVFAKGTRAASAAQDHTLRLWSLVSGQEELTIHNVHAGDQPWSQLHIDEKNSIIHWVSSSEVKAWHLETAVPAFQISTESQDGWLLTAVFVPRLVVVTLSEKGALCLWDGGTGQLHSKRMLVGLREEAPTCSVLLTKLGRMMAGFSKGALLTISSDGNSLLGKLPEGIRFLVLSEDESLLAAGSGPRVRVFSIDLKGFHCLLASDLMHTGEVCAAAISADNTTLFTSSFGECIWVWSLSKQGLLTDVLGDTGAPITHLTLWDSTLVSASLYTHYLRVWNIGYDLRHKPLPPSMACTRCTALSHNAKYVYFPQSNNSCKVVIWNSEEGEVCEVLDASGPVQCLEVAEQRNLLFVGLASGTVLVFPLDASQDAGCIPPAENQKPIHHLALSQHEEQLAIACDNLVQVLDMEQGEPGPLINRPAYTFYTQIPGAVISSMALLARYRVLYGMTSGELFLYDCSQAQVFPLEAHNSQVTCLKTSHAEKWAVSGSADSLRCLWDVDLCHWKHKMFFQKQDSSSHDVLCACFSKDDRYVFTGSLDQSITAWDVSQGEQF
ncbi:NACHT domain- and WD repeat-containing protein 1 [Eublepharis macularius]|uniref:NACHT domain- and WD repeat-containing protein 1 n=1 Tax=Eublepharis macularius TaxID=481883 RepID=A0AA97JE27_EUBMA|nr:NACHT domain- and WD repeat-containing protein 1 [Eublepharis macularius]